MRAVLLILIFSLSASTCPTVPDWGFFGHRKINRMAVFTLPPELIPLYKSNIEYMTEHGVDPDKRRYATATEAIRHYIDLDHWGEHPFDNVPRRYDEVLMKFTTLSVIESGDTAIILDLRKEMSIPDTLMVLGEDISKQMYQEFFDENIISEILYGADEISLETNFFGEENLHLLAIDHFSEHGINPYNSLNYYYKLREAFTEKDWKQVIKISADYGHYIADGHVPLHTSENYNGQLTNQVGIHGFWESRIPELFADGQFDLFTGKAEYIDNPQTYIWDYVLASHSFVDSVLAIEKRLSITYPSDEQYCFEERLQKITRTQCSAYAQTYMQAMDGMVEDRMKEAVKAIGSLWYSAWVDAGQPEVPKDLVIAWDDEDLGIMEVLENAFSTGTIKGRTHEN